MSDSVKLGVAIVGCGTVGGAAATILTRDADIVAQRSGCDIELKYVVDLDFSVARQTGLAEDLLCDNYDKVLADDSVDVVVELVGGLGFAREVIERACRAGKHVVTANKALLAHHGTELYALARSCGVCIAFEASCAGCVPIIRALNEGLIVNRIDAMFGIVNGTCNFILSEMSTKGRDYAAVLQEAQADGLAEADPSLDVSGEDSAHKLAILGAMAFGQKIEFDDIPTAGIDKLDLCDVAFGQDLGYVLKLLAIAERQADGLSLRVRPAFISKAHPLAWVAGSFNAVSVYGHVTGHTMYYGRGAGGMPTASAVVADLVSVAVGSAQRTFSQLGVWPDRAEQACQSPLEAVRSRYYLRILCEDRPGVFAQIAAILGEREISISSLLQHEPAEGQAGIVPVVVTTHQAREGDVRDALAKIDKLDTVKSQSVCLEIVEEYEE
ncbi:MAG: homoserine dehydrogenase [Planctomycetota bacterium]|nr:MAG: homoserine dehydrogenase [Planctomycetota bacterium]